MTSHYVPAFTTEESAAYNPSGRPSRYLRAVCGASVAYPREHSVEPMCPACQSWLLRDAEAVKAEGDEERNP